MDDSDSAGTRTRLGGVALALLAPSATGALVWALFTYVIADAGLTLDYLEALVWPAVVAVGLFWLRAPLRDKLRELLRAEGFGTSLEFQERANRRLETGLADAFDQLGITGAEAEAWLAADAQEPEANAAASEDGGASEPRSAVQPEPPETDLPEPTQPTPEPAIASVEPLDDLEAIAEALGVPRVVVEEARQRFEVEPEMARQTFLKSVLQTAGHDRSIRSRVVKQRVDARDGIEDIIRKSAAWGYDMGRAGAPEVVPDVEWNENGSWRIVTEVPKRKVPSHHPASQESGSLRQIKTLEDEIKTLERAKHNPIAARGISAIGDDAWLSELKRRLAMIDPGNPWAGL